MRYQLTIEYDGTDYVGWQRQDSGVSIQSVMEDAVFRYCGERTEVYGSGRTDAGVHAMGQVAHVDIERGDSAHKVQNALNFYLKNKNIVVVGAQEAREDFHSRFDATKRTYLYRISTRYVPPCLEKNRVWHLGYDLDVKAMQQAANFLLGKHDFTSFRSTACGAKSPIKTLEKLDVVRVNDEIHLHVAAKSFLHHQVRNFTGTLRDVGMGKMAPEQVKEILEARDRAQAGITAPACGLYLVQVDY